MATAAILVEGAIVNGIAFTLGTALDGKSGRTDGSDERYKHDKAVADLQNANRKWNQKLLDMLDFINSKVTEKSETAL